jgi:TolB-like protein/Tfp pilus assembly protein PilF
MTESSKAVFLSYASRDAEAARRICEALRAAGIEVWFDQSELRGGDVWDQKIRQQIHDCTLFIPVISAHTDERTEGYFRLEWKLAVDRSHLMADDAAFLFPVVIDDTRDTAARVPEKFRAVQWTRLPGGAAPPEFCQRVSAVLAGTARPARAQADPVAFPGRPSRRGPLIAGIAALLVAAIAVFAWLTMSLAPKVALTPQKVPASPATLIPEHSIAVLPFTDLSARSDQEYFSDGLAEALLNLLSKVPGMQVAARTSAFSFRGRDVDVPSIGRQLLVAHVLEGSVRKVGNHVRVTAQLVRTSDDYPIWSETYDRELGDVFRMQDEIAAAVFKALKVRLLASAAPRSLGTQNSDAYLVFLQGRAKMATQRLADTRAAETDFERTLKLDPNYGPAYVELATAKLQLAEFEFQANRETTFNSAVEESKLLIERGLALDPNDPQAYVERGYLRAFSDLSGAEQDYRRAIKLNPSSARGYDGLAAVLYQDPRRRDEALAMLVHARRLDPLEPKYDVLRAEILDWGRSNIKEADALLSEVVAHHPLYQPAWVRLADVRRTAGHYAEAIMYDEQALKLDPLSEWARRILIWNYIDVGDLIAARQVADQAPHPLPIHRIQFLIHDADWRRAAEVTYASLADGTLSAASEGQGVFALRMEARRTRDFESARAVFERICGVTWSGSGVPTIPPQLGFAYGCVALGDMLIAGGRRERGERLLRGSLADMDYVAHDLKRGEVWYVIDRATALALLGERKAALAALRKAVNTGYINTWELLPIEPAFDAFRGDAEFQTILRDMQAKMAAERQILDSLRASGQVPKRAAPGIPLGPGVPRPASAPSAAGAQ